MPFLSLPKVHLSDFQKLLSAWLWYFQHARIFIPSKVFLPCTQTEHSLLSLNTQFLFVLQSRFCLQIHTPLQRGKTKQHNTMILYKHVGTLLIELIHFLKENCISKWKDWFSCKNILNPSTRHLDIIRKKKNRGEKTPQSTRKDEGEGCWSNMEYR